jgi:hypothetical protein
MEPQWFPNDSFSYDFSSQPVTSCLLTRGPAAGAKPLIWDNSYNFGVAIIGFSSNPNLKNANQFAIRLDTHKFVFEID